MSPSQPVYKHPTNYDYLQHKHPVHHSHRKHSEGAVLIGNHHTDMHNGSSGFKTSSFPKKNNARKRVFSTNESQIMFDNKFGRFSGNLSNTKDSSTSSNPKYVSPPRKGTNGGQAQEAKSLYLIKLRKCIKDKEEDKLELEDLKGHASEIARDQVGSRFIQKIYEKNCSDPESKVEDIIDEIKNDAMTIMQDVFGNYVIQKILDCGTESHIQTLFDEIKGNILIMSKHIYGCRVVQRFIEILKEEDQKLILAELNDHVMECIYDQYGNHVIQKILKEEYSEHKVEFIQKHIDENCKDL